MPDSIPTQGVIIRAENGDVIRYDETGLILRLSDKVIADIAARLKLTPQAVTAAPVDAIPDLPDGIDLWSPRRIGDWLHFQANLPGATAATSTAVPLWPRRRGLCWQSLALVARGRGLARPGPPGSAGTSLAPPTTSGPWAWGPRVRRPKPPVLNPCAS